MNCDNLLEQLYARKMVVTDHTNSTVSGLIQFPLGDWASALPPYPRPLNRWTWNIAVGLILSVLHAVYSRKMYFLGLSAWMDSKSCTFNQDALGCLSNNRLVQFFIYAGDSPSGLISARHDVRFPIPSHLHATEHAIRARVTAVAATDLSFVAIQCHTLRSCPWTSS